MAHGLPPETPSLALLLQQVRTQRGLTQDELAARSGVSVRTISDLERGISRFPHRDTLRLLGEALRLTPEESAALLRSARTTRATSPAALVAEPGDEATEPGGRLFGRERECQAVADLLAGPQRKRQRLVTLVGPAGIGKTRLAVAVAARLRSAYDGRVTFVDLATLHDAAYVPLALALALDLRERANQPLIETLAAGLADQKHLLVLDNFEQVREAAPLVSALLERCAGVSFLVTSRHPLDVADERTFPVPPLMQPDLRQPQPVEVLRTHPAVELFVARARAVRPDFTLTPTTTRTIAKMCARLGGIPLAIELAAAWSGTVAPREMLAQLSVGSGRAFLSLLSRKPTEAPPRQRSMREALAWSYRLLDAREQVLFRRLGIFAGGWSVEAVEAVCGPFEPNAPDALERLAVLTAHSLVYEMPSHDDSGRFTLHAVVQAYAQDLLDERKERERLARSHAEYFAGLVERLEQALTGALQVQSLKRLVDEYENIRAALRWTRDHREAELGLRLAGSLWWFWETRGYVTEGQEWVESLLALWRQGVPVGDEALTRALYCATILAAGHADFTRAEEFAQLFLARTTQPGQRARVLLALANLAKFQRDGARARRLYLESVAILRDSNDVKGLLVALNNLSTLTIEQGDLEQSRALIKESLALKRQIGDQRGISVSLMNLGEIQKLEGAFAEAQRTLEEGLAIFRALDDRQGTALALNNLGELAAAQGDDARAIGHFEESLHEYRQIEDRPGEAMVLLNLGNAWARLRDAHADESLRLSVAAFDALNQPMQAIGALLARARFAWDGGDAAHATRLFDDATRRLRQANGPQPPDLLAAYAWLAAQVGGPEDSGRVAQAGG